jgi:hypothetical protein
MHWHETGESDVTTMGFRFVANNLSEKFKGLAQTGQYTDHCRRIQPRLRFS